MMNIQRSKDQFFARYNLLVLLAWTLPALVGFSFLIFIQMFTIEQVVAIMSQPLEPIFIGVSLIAAILYFNRFAAPLFQFAEGQVPGSLELILRRMRRFPLHFWALFLGYLVVAPSTVITSAEMYTSFEAHAVDWFRIHLIALIVSIIVGLPIFLLFLDLFGKLIKGTYLSRPHLSIKSKIFLIGALTPLLIDTMLVQYYWTRTGYFTGETFIVWLMLEMLAIGGVLLYVKSFNQSIEPLQGLLDGVETFSTIDLDSLRPQSTDELGVLAGDFRNLLGEMKIQEEALAIRNTLLKKELKDDLLERIYEEVVEIADRAMGSDVTFLLIYEERSQEMVIVTYTGHPYLAKGYRRLSIHETTLSGLVYRNRETLVVADAEADSRTNPEVLKEFSIRSAVAAPLLFRDRVLGVLVTCSQTRAMFFGPREVRLTEVLAQEAAMVAHTLSLHHRRQEAERNYQILNERAQVTLASIGDCVITTDINGNIDYLNPVAESLLEKDKSHLGEPFSKIVYLVDAEHHQPIESPVDTCLRRDCTVNSDIDCLLQTGGGIERAVEYSASPIRDRSGETIGVIVVMHDVTEMRSLSDQLSYQAKHDPLTGLVNRREFERRLEELLHSARTEYQSHALCYLDLDQFKIVNDTCGHVAGDELLRQLANLLQEKVRRTDTLARLGGDEFGVLLVNCPLDTAREVSNNLRIAMQDFRFAWQDHSFEIGVSIGLVPVNDSSGTLTDLLSAADNACYMAKEKGRNRIQLYQPGDSDIAKQYGEAMWVTRINEALREDRFQLYCQDIVPIKNSAEKGTWSEILLRLNEGDTVVPPMAFIPAAERYYLMPRIDKWVVEKCFYELSRQRGPIGSSPQVFAINLSGQSLSDDEFLDHVVNLYDQYDIMVGEVCFEITETAAIANLSQATRFISVLRKMGCRFSLDDFGSGLSSFAYLKNLDVDFLKIDGAFVRDMRVDPIDREMVKAINQVGHVMGLRTIAEYVENPETLELLKQDGVDYVQGHAVSPPRVLGVNQH